MQKHPILIDFTANAFASYCGLTPGEDSSGDSYHRPVSPSKGNVRPEQSLEAACDTLVRGTIGKKRKKSKIKQKDQDVKQITQIRQSLDYRSIIA